jgi:two-component system, NarL family, response regulator YdfI
MTKVLVVADSAIVRAGLEAMLRDDGRFDVIRDEVSLDRFLLSSRPRSGVQPDVVLLDMEDRSLPWLAQSDFRSHLHDPNSPPLVVMMDSLNRGELIQALDGGVSALLQRDARPAEIFAAIEAAAAGLIALGSEQIDLLLPAIRSETAEEPALIEALSPRELEVLGLMSRGLPNKNIADRLAISEHTVKFHVSSILSKLGAASRTEAVARGLKNGLLIL